MDRRYIILLAMTLLLGCSLTATAQRQRATAANRSAAAADDPRASRNNGALQGGGAGRVAYKANFMRRQGDSLVVSMDIDLTRLNLATNHSQVLTPVIGSETEELELPKVMVQGEARNKAFQRELELNDYAYEEFLNNPPIIVKPKGVLPYRFSVAYEDWMEDAYLDVEEDLCGCGDQAKVARTRVFDGVGKQVVAAPAYKVKAQTVYLKPDVEPVKKRHEIGNAYLEFPRGKNEIYPELGPNPRELAKIDKMLRDVSSNKDVTVQGIYMTGFASPESSVKFNTELSRSRAESMMRYFMNNSALPSSLFETRTGGEDWEGLLQLMEDFQVPYKNEMLRVINSVGNLDEREHALERIAGGQPYKIIYDQLFPKLRRVVCEVDYTVRDFSIEEAKENISIAPQLLSLNEFYLVANEYPVGSPKFLEIFEKALKEFPDDPTANLNGAAAALMKGKLNDAAKYLRLSDQSTPEYANNMGVYLMLKGEYAEAQRLLKRAEAAGIEEATANLRELKKKLANINNRREAGVEEEDAAAQPAAATRGASTSARRATRSSANDDLEDDFDDETTTAAPARRTRR